jgi:hypothetical protein
LGTVDVFGLQELADNISIMSPRACISVNNVVYWMGLDKFYAYDGRVQTLPCTIREYIFKDINYGQADQFIWEQTRDTTKSGGSIAAQIPIGLTVM